MLRKVKKLPLGVIAMAVSFAATLSAVSAITSIKSAPIQGRAPVAKNLVVTMGVAGSTAISSAVVDQDLHLKYEFADADGDTEVSSDFAWEERALDAEPDAPYSLIDGATSSELKLVGSLINKVVRGCITPKTNPVTSLPSIGEQSCSTPVSVSAVPVVERLEWHTDNIFDENSTIKATYALDLKGGANKSKYVFSNEYLSEQLATLVDNNPESDKLSPLNTATSSGEVAYVITAADIGRVISLAVLPNNGTVGAAKAISTELLRGTSTPPELVNVAISRVSISGGHRHCPDWGDAMLNCNVQVNYDLINSFTNFKDDITHYTFSVRAPGEGNPETIISQGQVQPAGVRPRVSHIISPSVYNAHLHKELLLTLTTRSRTSDGTIREGDKTKVMIGKIYDISLKKVMHPEKMILEKNTATLKAGETTVKFIYPSLDPLGVHPGLLSKYSWNTRPLSDSQVMQNPLFQDEEQSSDLFQTRPFTIPVGWSGKDLWLSIQLRNLDDVNVGLVHFYAGKIDGSSLANSTAIPQVSNLRILNPENYAKERVPAFTYDFKADNNFFVDATYIEVFNSPDGQNLSGAPLYVNGANMGIVEFQMPNALKDNFAVIKVTPRTMDVNGNILKTGTPVEFKSKGNYGPGAQGKPYWRRTQFSNLRIELQNPTAGYVVGNTLTGRYTFDGEPNMNDVSKYLWSVTKPSAGQVESKGTVVTKRGETASLELKNEHVGTTIYLGVIPAEIDSTGHFKQSYGLQTVVASDFVKKGSLATHDLVVNGLGYQYLPDGDGETLTDGAQMHTWNHANTKCQVKGAGWRLPSVSELQAISQEKVTRPASWPKNHLYWSREEVAKPDYWTVLFESGEKVQYGGGSSNPGGMTTPAVCVKPI
ncbi:hypothetical protein ACEUAY_16795 [Aeromonas veronii]